MEEYQSSRSTGGDLHKQQQQRDYGFPRPNSNNAASLRSTPVQGRLSSSREQSPAVNKSSPDNSSMSNEVGHQTTKDKPHRRFNLFRKKTKVTEQHSHHQQPTDQGQPNACSSGDDWDSSSSVSSSSNNNINNNNNNNNLNNSQNRSSLLSTLSRKCSKKFRNLTDRTRNENNSQKPESQNGVHVSGRESGEVCSNHVLSGGSNEGGKRQQKADGHHGKFDLFSSCRKVPGSPRDSLDSISRRVRKDALKARVEAQREQQYPESSSDDEEQFSERASYLRRYHSDESLQKRWPGDRLPKVNRTERYYRRKGKEDDSSSKCDDYVVQPRKDFSNNPTHIRRNQTFGGSASPCSSPQPALYQRGGPTYRSNYSKYEEIKIQSSQYLTPGVRTTQRSTREESNIENIVVSGYLPLRKASLVDGHLHRAPTPPLRSSFSQPQPQPRPQSFNFGDVNVSNGRRHVRGNGTIVTSPSAAAAGPMTLVMTSSEAPLRNESGRPLSFTSTSHVIYNHHVPGNNGAAANNNHDFMTTSLVENGGRSRGTHFSTSSETPPVAYMSDSQISGRSRSSKSNLYEAAWRKQSQQLNRNFNSVPKPWNTISTHDENCSNNSRPPPSPSRNSESFNFGASTNGPLSPKYSTQMQSKVVVPQSSFRNQQQQQLQSTRKYPNNLNDLTTVYVDNGGRTTIDESAPLPPTRKYFRQQQSRSSNLESVSHRLGKLVNGNNNNNNNSNKCKLSDNHLEDALLELEKIYHSMKNDDDDTEEQSFSKGRRNSTCEDLLLHSSKESENTVQLVVDGLGSYNTLEGRPRSAQGNRNGSIPNKLTDDLAYRKIARQAESANRPSYMATGSYLLRSPALSPSVSIDDVRTAKVTSSSIIGSSNEPDTVLDDLSFRNIRDANLQKVIDPQPPFGIPLGPISNASSTDYMHAQAQDLSRPKMRRRFRPDLVKDDLAYRNLRKDNEKVEIPPGLQSSACLNFDELDSILSSELQAVNRKKHRAARSLSANLSQIISQNKMLGASSSTSSSATSIKVNHSSEEKSLSVSDLRSAGENDREVSSINEQKKPLVIETKVNLRPTESNNATSSSTDTLTDFGPTQQPPLVPLRQQGFLTHNGPSASFRPLPAEDSDLLKPANDIWQVRVTMGSEPSSNNNNSNNQTDGKATGHPPLVKPIPLKLESFRGTSHRFGSVLDDDSHAKNKGSPIDEVKLDELLSSLALDTVQPPPVVTCNGQQSIGFSDKQSRDHQTKCDGKSSSETFPALVTVDGSGEMSVKILFPSLKSSTTTTKDSNDTAPYGNGIEEQGRLVNRVLKVASGSSRGEAAAADDRNRKEMSSVPARPRSFIANQCVDEKFVGSRIGVRSPLTVKKDVKDGLTSSERAVTLKRSGAFHSKSTATNNKSPESPLPANGNSTTMPDSESHTVRMARYKEERRKQLANQFGQWSTREDGSTLGNEPSYMRYSQRSKKGATETATNGSDNTKTVSNKTGGNDEESTIKKTTRVENNHKDENTKTSNEAASKDNERTSPVDSMVRLNRASRLRAQARANETTAPEFSNRSGSFRSSRNTYGANSSKDSTPVKSLNRSATPISSSSEAPINSTQAGANNQPIGNESESGGTASDTTTGRLKDKSAKRKSNLNRMGSVDNTPIPSDSGDDTSRRFRRHRYSFADKSSNCSTDGVQSDSLKSSRAVRALQPQTTLPTSPSKSSSKSNSTLEKKEDKAGLKSGYIEDGTSESDADRKSNSRKLKRPTLKRPEIPDIFRSKGSAVPDENGDVGSHKPSSFAQLPNVVRADDTLNSPAGGLNDEITLKLKYSKVDSSPTTPFSTCIQTPSIDLNAQQTLDVVKNNELKTRENYLCEGSSYKVNHFSGVATKTGDMGGRLFKDASNVDADVDVPSVSVSQPSETNHGDDDVIVERERYDPGGNWHLGKSSLSDIFSADASADVVIRTSKMFGDQNDAKTKNRMAVAYGINDVNNGDAGCSTGETSGWPTSTSPSVLKKSYNVTIPVNADDSNSRRSDSSDELWLSIENEMKKRHVEMESGVNKPAVIIVEGSTASASPRRKKSDEVELPTKSILKSKEDLRSVDGRPPIPHSILKRGSIDEVSRSRSPEKCSILKKRGSSEESDHRSDSPEIVSILRRKSTEEAEDSERHSILRRKSMLDETEHTRSQEYHSILKKQCSLDGMDVSHSEPKPILKKKSSTEEIEQSEPKPILKKRSSTEEEYEEKPKPILKTRRRSGHEDLMEMEPVEQVEVRRTSRHKTSSPVLRFKHVEDELPSVPNRLSSTSSRHLTTSSEEEFVSVPSSPGSWMQRKSIDEDDDLTSSQRWERNAAYALLNGKDGLSPLKDVDDLPFADSSLPHVSSKFDEEVVGGDTTEKKLSSSSSSSSSDSSTEEEEEEEEEEDESEEQTEEEEEEETEVQQTTASITAGKTDSVNDASVQSSSSRIQDEKPLHPAMSTVQSSSERTTIGSESVHVKSEAVSCKAPVATRHQSSSSTYLTHESELESKRVERIAIASTSKVDQVESSSSSVQRTDKSDVVKAKIPHISKVNQTDVNSSGGDDQEDVTRLSVAERASLFMQKLKSQKQQAASTTQTQPPASVSRFVNRRGLQRSQTQPVTVCEVNEASKIAEESVKRQRHSAEYEDMETKTAATTMQPESNQGKSGTSESDDDPSKLSLADRVKLFNQKMIEERLPTRKMSSTEEDIAGSPPKEKPRRAMISRFKTQPVTSEELEKAQMISSLESHFAKQQEIKIVSKEPSESLCTSQTNTSTDDYKPKGILKKKEDVHVSHVKSAVTVESKNGSVMNANSVTKSIEAKVSNKTSSTELKSILKMDTYIKQASGFKTVKGKQEESSSSSDNDDEDESEGFTINLRNGSSNIISRGSTDEDSSSHSQSSSLSSGSSKQETGKQIKNEAVSRRRKAAIRKQEERKSSEIQLSQSINVAQSFEHTSAALRSVLSGELIQRNRKTFPQRSSTQPLTQMEKDGAVLEIKGGSIAERLAALKASQEEDWKRRLERNKASEVDGGSPSIGEDSKMIHEKVILLAGSQQEWKRRVEEKDATKFTVAGKMGKVSPPHESPVLDRKRRVPKPTRFQSRTCANLPELAKGSPVSTLPPKCSSITRSKSLGDAKDTLNEEKSLTRVSVPKPDDEGFSSFFESVNLDKLRSQKIEIHEEAFNQIVSESRQFLVQKRSVHVTRRHAGTRNPLKTLAAREDLQDEYTETVTGVAEKELRRLRVEQLAKHSDLATSALAGLASTEDFTSVSLRKSSSVVNASLLPYKDIMLIQVKGRRHVQCRLVEPVIASLNKGDNFILVTPNEVYNWIGEFSNVIERVKGAEISTIIQTKRDLGYKGSGEVVTFDEEKHTGGRGKRRDFFERLGGQDDIADPGSPEDDEIYEAAITETNKVYKVEGDELVPYDKYWGSLLRTEMLVNTEVLVFDFGGEMYVWQGKLAPNELRKKAVQLAQELWEDGYDYSECDISPISPSRNNLPKYGKKRPLWALFSKINQHMETVLFRSKFLDWPDLERVIQVRRQESDTKNDGYADLQPYDAQLMIETKPSEPDLILENCHLGRGVHYWDETERRLCNISKLGVKVWHVLEYNHSILPLESWGQFHSSDTYVVRWQYRVAVTGRDLTGQVSKHCALGRERCAYFFWQGRYSTINEKGASALMTVELDEERGPHIRVDQGQEHPCFLNLFEGKMICYMGKRGDEVGKVNWRLFILRGELESEAHLVEVKCTYRSLRESGVFVLVDCSGGIVYMWTGTTVQSHSKDVARFVVENLVQRRPTEMGFQLGMLVDMKEEEQGSESKEFLEGVGCVSQSQIRAVMPKIQTVTCTPRLFHMTSVSGAFLVSEVFCSFRSCEHVVSYPFHQNDLYLSPQPSIFLLDRGDEIYVWQGWWPVNSDENETSGSAHLRWNVERRLALETAVNYCNAKGKEKPSAAYTVWAGLEPPEFKQFFPEWEDLDEATESNKMNGRQEGEKKSVVDVLAQLKRTRYPLAELQERPLPEGVDPSIIETYLTDDEFEEVLKTNREDFNALPSWKQFNIKKSAGLY